MTCPHLQSAASTPGKGTVDTHGVILWQVRIYKVKRVSLKSKLWAADPANRVCDAPGSWYCVGQYPPALQAFDTSTIHERIHSYSLITWTHSCFFTTQVPARAAGVHQLAPQLQAALVGVDALIKQFLITSSLINRQLSSASTSRHEELLAPLNRRPTLRRQLEDFNVKRDAASQKYHEEYMRRMGGGAGGRRAESAAAAAAAAE